jgi:two-component system, response regulator
VTDESRRSVNLSANPDLDPVDIVLVEDSPADAELALRVLKRHNLANRVLVLKDGAEALGYFFAPAACAAAAPAPPRRPKVVLLDIKLPKVSGLEVLRALKSDERTKAIPVVVLTSSKEEPDINESYALGVNSYVVKPVEFDEFARVVAELGCYWLVTNHAGG